MKTKQQILALISSIPTNEKKLKVLKFGCNVKLKKAYGNKKKGDIGVFAGMPDECVIVFDGRHNMLIPDYGFEILGIPPELPELLVAVEDVRELGEVAMCPTGEFMEWSGSDWIYTEVYYDLSLTLSENLDRPEFLKFISNILK